MNEKRANLDQLKDALSGFDLNEAETAVYGAALRLGTRQASLIAKAAGLNRAYTYDILSSLKSKGLVQEGVRNKVRHYTCTPPQHLVSLLEQREEQMAARRRLLKRCLPELLAMQSPLSTTGNHVRWFQGADASKTLLENISTSACGVVRCALSSEALGDDKIQRLLSVVSEKEEVEEIKVLRFGSDALYSTKSAKITQRNSPISLEHLDFVLANDSLHFFIGEPKPLSLIISHQSLQFSATQLFETVWMTSIAT